MSDIPSGDRPAQSGPASRPRDPAVAAPTPAPDRREGLRWQATPGQNIIELDEASAWVELGHLFLQLGGDDRKLVTLRVPLAASPPPALDVHCAGCDGHDR